MKLGVFNNFPIKSKAKLPDGKHLLLLPDSATALSAILNCDFAKPFSRFVCTIPTIFAIPAATAEMQTTLQGFKTLNPKLYERLENIQLTSSPFGLTSGKVAQGLKVPTLYNYVQAILTTLKSFLDNELSIISSLMPEIVDNASLISALTMYAENEHRPLDAATKGFHGTRIGLILAEHMKSALHSGTIGETDIISAMSTLAFNHTTILKISNFRKTIREKCLPIEFFDACEAINQLIDPLIQQLKNPESEEQRIERIRPVVAQVSAVVKKINTDLLDNLKANDLAALITELGSLQKLLEPLPPEPKVVFDQEKFMSTFAVKPGKKSDLTASVATRAMLISVDGDSQKILAEFSCEPSKTTGDFLTEVLEKCVPYVIKGPERTSSKDSATAAINYSNPDDKTNKKRNRDMWERDLQR